MDTEEENSNDFEVVPDDIIHSEKEFCQKMKELVRTFQIAIGALHHSSELLEDQLFSALQTTIKGGQLSVLSSSTAASNGESTSSPINRSTSIEELTQQLYELVPQRDSARHAYLAKLCGHLTSLDAEKQQLVAENSRLKLETYTHNLTLEKSKELKEILADLHRLSSEQENDSDVIMTDSTALNWSSVCDQLETIRNRMLLTRQSRVVEEEARRNSQVAPLATNTQVLTSTASTTTTSDSSTTTVIYFVCEVCTSRYRSTAGLRYHYHSQHSGYTPKQPISASASRMVVPVGEERGIGGGLRGGRPRRNKASTSKQPAATITSTRASQTNTSPARSPPIPPRYQLPEQQPPSASTDNPDDTLFPRPSITALTSQHYWTDGVEVMQPEPTKPSFDATEEEPWCPNCKHTFASRDALEDHFTFCLT